MKKHYKDPYLLVIAVSDVVTASDGTGTNPGGNETSDQDILK